jgi:hypothetical protein
MWYEFHQNNSGGSFYIDGYKGIGPNVWIEADSEEAANDIAEGIGIYFDGVEKERDCSCCGDRWYPASHGQEAPIIDTMYNFFHHPNVYLHGKNGEVVTVTDVTLIGVLTDVDIPLRQDLFCFVTDGSEEMLKVWKYKHTLYGETIHNFLIGPE